MGECRHCHSRVSESRRPMISHPNARKEVSHARLPELQYGTLERRDHDSIGVHAYGMHWVGLLEPSDRRW